MSNEPGSIRSSNAAARRSAFAAPRRGAAAVEFAFALPVLLAIGLGCADFGRVFHTALCDANAARVGADHAATRRFRAETRDDWEADVREAVREELANAPISGDDAAISITTTDEGADRLRIVVTVTRTFHTLVAWPGLPHEIPLRSTVVAPRYR